MENRIKSTNYFIKELDQNELMSNKNEKVYMTLNYIELTLLFAVTEYISISAFASLFDIPTVIFSSTIRLNFCAIIV